MIRVNNLTKKYGDVNAVNNLSFHIEKGTIVGFVGKNGAGKTTTIRCMLDLLKPTSGIIEINGLDSIKQSKEIKEFSGYMPGDPNFYENMKCSDLFKFTCIVNNADYKRVKFLVDYFDLDIDKKIKELSLGNKKKVAIILALIKEIKLLILDEPTSGLDPFMQMKFFDLLLELKKKGVTIFLSSHNLTEIQKYCDRVLIIKDGKLIDDLDMKNVEPSLKQIVYYKTKSGEEVRFENEEDINSLIKHLGKLDLQYLEIKYASVEDEFIKYYKEQTDEKY